MITRLGANYNARESLIQFFQENYDKIYHRFSKSMGAMGNSVNYMISGVYENERIQQLEFFFAEKDTNEYTRGLHGGLEKAKVNAAQIQREHNEMKNWASK
jgi:hypothetical protein